MDAQNRADGARADLAIYLLPPECLDLAAAHAARKSPVVLARDRRELARRARLPTSPAVPAPNAP